MMKVQVDLLIFMLCLMASGMQARLEAQGLYGHLSAQAQACVRLQAWWRLQAGIYGKAAADLAFLLDCYPNPGKDQGRLRALRAHALMGLQKPAEALHFTRLAMEEASHDFVVRVRVAADGSTMPGPTRPSTICGFHCWPKLCCRCYFSA